jgi:hypothetical protein
MGISLRPSSFTAGGGLIDDADVEITKARFVQYDFEGKSENGPSLCLMLVLADTEKNDHVQYFSAGNLAYFVPSEDPKNPDLNGITIVKVGDKESLNGGTNTAIMLNSLVQAGFPEDKMDAGDVRVLEGLVGHVNRVPQPKRSNIAKKEGQRDPMVLVFTKILSMPGEQKKGAAAKTTAAAKSASATATTASTNGSDELVEELTGELIGLFAAKGVSELKKVEISKGLFGTIDKTNPNKNKLISMAAKDDVLKSLEGFSYNGSVLTQE